MRNHAIDEIRAGQMKLVLGKTPGLISQQSFGVFSEELFERLVCFSRGHQFPPSH